MEGQKMKINIKVLLKETGVSYKKNSIFLKSVILLFCLLIIYGCASLDSGNYRSRIRAVKKITDQNLLYKIAMENKMPSEYYQTVWVRNAAVRRLRDLDLLTKVAMKNQYKSVRITAVERLTDQAKLIHIAENNSDWDVRKAAFNKLNNKSLTTIITEAKDPAVILAAKIRLGQTNWKKIFTKSSSSNNKLGDVIGAVALVKNPQPASSDVVAACHNYIRRGDASRIPELIDLLTRFGNKTLAEDYMNCGNSRLKSAGETWGRKHGYNIRPGAGSHRVRWGESKW